MDLERLSNNPLAHTHDAYRKSVYEFPAKPEDAAGFVIMAAAYRAVGLAQADERHLPLDAASKLASRLRERGDDNTVWASLVGEDGAFVVPPRKGQRGKPALQTVSVVPSIANWTGVVGKGGRRWKPHKLVKACLAAGASRQEREEWFDDVRQILSVGQSDDMLAAFLEDTIAGVEFDHAEETQADAPCVAPYDVRVVTPGRSLRSDLMAIAKLKPRLTRRQWVGLVEAILRIGVSAHLLWLMHANVQLWHACKRALRGRQQDADDLAMAMSLPSDSDGLFFTYGERGIPALRRQIRAYAQARIGIQVLLAHLDDIAPWTEPVATEDNWLPGTLAFLEHVKNHADEIDAEELIRAQVRIVEENHAQVIGTAGSLRNTYFFLRYVLGQMSTRDPSERFHDGAYALVDDESRRGPRVDLGPTTLLALAYSCHAKHPNMPISLDDFKHHLFGYGFSGYAGSDNDILGKMLEAMGLLIDSPDAAGGRLLANPFPEAAP